MHSIFLSQTLAHPRTGGSSAKVTVGIPVARITSLSRDQWPLWAHAVARFGRDSDVGLGDTIVHLIGGTRSERFKKWFGRKFGRSCGCVERQKWLNRRFPYTVIGL
ncbi:MAG TPA: hypothetical protein VG938_17345 [Verrucomicrobiae bacterium]|jgi:hypothetical protein|nr:hypothetical protein [Verrucomicrobiae bacterium]